MKYINNLASFSQNDRELRQTSHVRRIARLVIAANHFQLTSRYEPVVHDKEVRFHHAGCKSCESSHDYYNDEQAGAPSIENAVALSCSANDELKARLLAPCGSTAAQFPHPDAARAP